MNDSPVFENFTATSPAAPVPSPGFLSVVPDSASIVGTARPETHSWPIPFSENNSPIIKLATRAARHATNAVFQLRKEVRLVRIFIVDDSATARASLRAALETRIEQRAEWVVVGEAFSGHHALATFHLHNAHLTRMDFIMPQMSGLEAARQLTERHSDALILMAPLIHQNNWRLKLGEQA
jgi:CheY-like chemotaxis protein